jgi:O-acetyl-ADP-ribose deacetylase (regulator of RNase III)
MNLKTFLLKDNNLHSISFPLISSGIFAGNLPNPAEESAKQCNRAYKKFIQNYLDYDIDVLLCAYGSQEYNDAKTIFNKVRLGVDNSLILSNDFKQIDCHKVRCL